MQQQDIIVRFKTSQKHFTLNVDVKLPARGITAIWGQSGSGKTTLLRCIAGLEKAQQGMFKINNQEWQNANLFLPTHKRPFGYVFQEASLFPHLTAQENLDYAIKRAPAKTSQDTYDKILAIMGIENILNRHPQHLSGGERQRVAIARALLIQPQLLLMDEPLASLDHKRKTEIMPYLEQLNLHFDIPILYVSHSIDEVARLADHIVALENGHVIAQGGLLEVLSKIDSPLDIGEKTGAIIEGKIVEKDSTWHLAAINLANNKFWFRDNGEALNKTVRLRILARDVSIALSQHQDSSITNKLPAVISDIVADQKDVSMSLVQLEIDPGQLIARISNKSINTLSLNKGSTVWAQIKSAAVVN
ncbi:molybdenum ABC transporter ATP-binding protein [Algibacillus agarilyticus]|uniref:molybdenum ABC transporter ATP-binding protein n=1 Tax=Algibacillus agarilyticus TaxID=2234133 RepID=UPI000DD01950|nr:molybdenum ABC transporter ATP-binding protein [Algibacillus agarilyticus]